MIDSIRLNATVTSGIMIIFFFNQWTIVVNRIEWYISMVIKISMICVLNMYYNSYTTCLIYDWLHSFECDYYYNYDHFFFQIFFESLLSITEIISIYLLFILFW